MRILMTTDCVGGVWTYAIELSRALAPHNIEVVLATMGPAASDSQRREVAALANVTLIESTWRLEWQDSPWDDVAAAGQWLLGLERKYRPDVVHLNGYAHGALPWRAPCVVVAHSCVASWWQAVKGEAAPVEWDRYRWAVSLGIGGADAVVAPTRAMLDCVVEHHARPANGVVISNSRDPAEFDLRLKEPFIFSAGRLWDPAKNLAAMQRVAGKVTWPIHVAGDTAAPEQQPIATKGVHCLGRLDTTDMRDHLSRASIYALPARYEPFGLSVLEAALSGCALVLGDIPSLREVWGDAALFVPPDDTDALAKALQLLCINSIHRNALADHARQHAKQYTPQRMASSYVSLYEQLIATPHNVASPAATPPHEARAIA